MRVCNVKPSLCCGGFTLACNRAAGSGSVGSLPSWTVLVVVMDLSKLWSPHKSQPDDGTPPAVDPPLEPVTQAQPRMAAGMARSLPAGTSMKGSVGFRQRRVFVSPPLLQLNLPKGMRHDADGGV